MYKTDQLIYIQMQKTGCTHIALLLSKLFGGEQIGKHNAATKDDIASNKYFFSSIRNPWDWYLSLWTFGVQGKGNLRNCLTKRNFVRPFRLAIRNPKEGLLNLFHELSKDVNFWRDLYDGGDIKSFRIWLNLIHDPANSKLLGEGYGDTVIANFCGFMTYRYLYLCCRDVSELRNPRSVSNYNDLVQFEQSNRYVDFFVRQESLEDDLCEVIEKVRPLKQEERNLIYGATKTNTSIRSFPISDYYDDESIELIRSRERLLIEKFDYSPPETAQHL